ncbi:hypothetical protein JCM8097_006097 [Rhodosporidiobolus ruineniae]
MALTLSAAQCARAASAYRSLLRAQRLTFKGDDFALKAAHQQTRILFNRFIPSSSASSSLSPFAPNPSYGAAPELKPAEGEELTPQKVDEHIEAAFEIAKFLRTNVVQGVRNDEGNYALRIHEETERGDNESVRKGREEQLKKLAEMKNSNAGVRRRRRRNAGAEADEAATPAGGCCRGGAA